MSGNSSTRSSVAPSPVVCECGHGWSYHHDFDDWLERFEPHGCEHWSGCECKLWKPSVEAIGGCAMTCWVFRCTEPRAGDSHLCIRHQIEWFERQIARWREERRRASR